MATFAIGDIQGCLSTLTRLLTRMHFTPGRDRLWLVGDLVNRGPDSLGVLRLLYAHRDSVVAVLGNHDLALLATARGVRRPRDKDTFAPLLRAPDGPALLAWLTERPFAHFGQGHLLIHAGLLPGWDLTTTLDMAERARRALLGPHGTAFLQALDKATPEPPEALRPAVEAARVLTYLRVVDAAGAPRFAFKGARQDVPEACVPWFLAPGRKTQAQPIVCGHWAALGLYVDETMHCLDTGCVWGGPMTAWCLETGQLFAEPNAEPYALLRDE